MSHGASVSADLSHRLSTVRNADQIAVLDHGRLIETGDHITLLAGEGRYAELAA
jgi:ATP-binding cassette, subfamily B, bacterial